jgi:hypothetical protein
VRAVFARKTAASDLEAEALRLAQGLGWPVARGTRLLPNGRCSCRSASCPAPGLHPDAAGWRQSATPDRARIESWWREQPQAGIVLPTGLRFDVLRLPPRPACEVLGALEKRGSALGPVAATAEGQVLFFVQPGARVAARRVQISRGATGRAVLSWGLSFYGDGAYVVAPPSGRGGPHAVTWLVSPFGRTAARTLPAATELLPLIAAACHGPAIAQPA